MHSLDIQNPHYAFASNRPIMAPISLTIIVLLLLPAIPICLEAKPLKLKQINIYRNLEPISPPSRWLYLQQAVEPTSSSLQYGARTQPGFIISK